MLLCHAGSGAESGLALLFSWGEKLKCCRSVAVASDFVKLLRSSQPAGLGGAGLLQEGGGLMEPELGFV